MFVYAILLILPALALGDDPREQLEKELFAALDANKDGKVTKAETETYFLTFDSDKDGTISSAEFTTHVDSLDAQFKGKETVLYGLFDQTKDKKVDKSDIDAVFVLADANGDGSVDKNEFHTVFQAVISLVGS